MKIRAKIPLAAQCLAFVSILALPRLAAFDPNNPAAYGHQLVFNSQLQSSEVDVGDTGSTGYNWYVRKPFSYPSSAATFAFGSNGVTITPTVNTSGYHLATAYPSGSSYVGTVFGPGWYVEAQVSFDPTIVNTANKWPAFWSLAWPGFTSTPQDYWPEQGATYRHNDEDDMFEYDQNSHLKYGTSIHDWMGTVPFASPPSVHSSPGAVTLGADPIWTNFHRIGQLWVKGTAANGYNGYVTDYFDGVPYVTINWTWKDQSNATVGASGPVPTSYDFGRMDDMARVIILGSGVGAMGADPQPFNVKSVQVWRLPDTNMMDFKFENKSIDYSGFGNNGTVEGSGTTYLTGGQQEAGDYCINFNGSGYVSVPDSASIDTISSEMAIDVWVYPTSTTGYRRIVNKMTTGGVDAFYLDLTPTTNLIRFNVRGTQITTTSAVPISTWTHIRATFIQNGKMGVWINDVLDTSVTAPNLPAIGNTLPVEIAADNGGIERWVGRIDELQISPIVNAHAAEYKFESNLNDNSGEGNNGTLEGTGTTYASSGGHDGSYISFNGSGYVNVPDSPSIDAIGSQLAIDVWVYPTTTTGYRRIVNKMTSGGTDAFYLDLTPTTNLIRFNVRGTQITTVGAVPINAWTHIRATYIQNSKMAVYINDAEDTLITAPNVPAINNALPVRIAADNDGGSKLTGRIDDLVISPNMD